MSAVGDRLKHFKLKNDHNFTLDSVDNEEKERVFQLCIQQLYAEHSDLLSDCVGCLRILTRDDQYIDRFLSEEFTQRLLSIAVDRFADRSVSVEALKALSNVVYKRHSIITQLKANGIVHKLVDRLRLYSSDEEPTLLFTLKLLFILSSLDPIVRNDLSENTDAFKLFADFLATCASHSPSDTDKQLMCEILKIVYNIGYAIQHGVSTLESHLSEFNRYVTILRGLLSGRNALDKNGCHILQHVVNFLNVVPKRSFVNLIFPVDETSTIKSSQLERLKAVQTLIDFLDFRLSTTCSIEGSSKGSMPTNLDEELGPILMALTRAVQGNREIRKYCRTMILPHLRSEVKFLPEEGTSLRNRLCKLLTNPSPGVSELAALFVFVLCKEDIGRAVKYTGFGNFAGFLTRHALLGGASKKRTRIGPSIPNDGLATSNVTSEDSAEDYSSASSVSDTEEYEHLKDSVNPVTGRWEQPKPDPLQGMSEEQKEHVTMELVDKIDQLQRSGIIQPGTIGEDGRVKPVEHVLQLLENTKLTTQAEDDESD